MDIKTKHYKISETERARSKRITLPDALTDLVRGLSDEQRTFLRKWLAPRTLLENYERGLS